MVCEFLSNREIIIIIRIFLSSQRECSKCVRQKESDCSDDTGDEMKRVKIDLNAPRTLRVKRDKPASTDTYWKHSKRDSPKPRKKYTKRAKLESNPSVNSSFCSTTQTIGSVTPKNISLNSDSNSKSPNKYLTNLNTSLPLTANVNECQKSCKRARSLSIKSVNITIDSVIAAASTASSEAETLKTIKKKKC